MKLHDFIEHYRIEAKYKAVLKSLRKMRPLYVGAMEGRDTNTYALKIDTSELVAVRHICSEVALFW